MMEAFLAKGQKRSTREKKKPKQDKAKAVTSSPFAPPSPRTELRPPKKP
jgi:hypothetical protein